MYEKHDICRLPRQLLDVNYFLHLDAYHTHFPVRPDPSLKRSANGRSPGPGRWYAVQFRQPGPGVLPPSPASLERWAA